MNKKQIDQRAVKTSINALADMYFSRFKEDHYLQNIKNDFKYFVELSELSIIVDGPKVQVTADAKKYYHRKS